MPIQLATRLIKISLDKTDRI